MIITLSPTFSKLSDLEWRPYLPAIENLVQAHLQGWHFFIPDRQSITALIRHPELSERLKEILSVTIGEKLTVLQGYANASARRIVCERSDEHSVGNSSSVRLPLVVFVDLDNCLKSKLIVENAESDAVFYSAVAQEALALGSLLPSLSLEYVAGGGHTTAGRVADAVLSPRPSIIIIDSDRVNPTSPEGGTAQAARRSFIGRYQYNHILVVTNVRALENFIPFSAAPHFLSDDAALKRAKSLASWQEIEKIDNRPTKECVSAYYGPRKGLKIKAYRTADRSFQDMINNLALHLGEPFTPPINTDNSCDNLFAILPLSTNYAGLFLGKVKESGLALVKSELSSGPFADELEFIAGQVAAFGAAPLKSAARIAA